MSSLDFDRVPPGHEYNASISPGESSGDRRVRLFKDVVLFLVAVALVVLIVWLSYVTLSSASASADEKRWAQSLLSAATGGLIGYLVRGAK